ncbi:MAG TPA: Gldg family protein [Pirellulaceae bacterium]|jgi:ABC-2 type transport system permease protein|nr:Gldg family protein [Pirellulaceae bacterium]
MTTLVSFLMMALIDLACLGGFFALLLLCAVVSKPAYAVLRRNFMGYFINPSGYIFLVLFVLLTSCAAFLPNDFFVNNLANLDQLNVYLPYIMLVFVPTITMSVWSEERRQGTDELLLTLPATDFDIVVGKYLAAASIFSVSLLFSKFCIFTVLILLTEGDVDFGLLYANFAGYWAVGLAMLAIGMAASFLTNNLTVGFILGMLFNAPLVFLVWAETFWSGRIGSDFLADLSVGRHLDVFGRGVVSAASIIYFAAIVLVWLYLCMVLIGRRHWLGGRDGNTMIFHYFGRAVGIALLAIGLTLIVQRYDWRADASESQLNTLSPDTLQILKTISRNLGDPEKEPNQPVEIDAYISPDVPELYAPTKYDLISKLRAFKAAAGDALVVRIHENVEPFSEEAAIAASRFGIVPQRISTRERGAIQDQEVILGAAFQSGPRQAVVVPFFDYGLPVEYELIRSINTVAQKERKRLGVVRTDANLMGGFDFAGGQPRPIPQAPVIAELAKQYDVEQVDPNEEIPLGRFDVLLAVQPSSLAPAALTNLTNAVRQGQPTAIFEDPAPIILQGVPGTTMPKQQPGMMGMMGGPPPEKGDMQPLWDLLGIKPLGERKLSGFDIDLVWQDFNPYQEIQIQGFTEDFVFIRPDAPGSEDPFNPGQAVTSGIEEVLFPMPGGIEKAANFPEGMEFVPLVTTGDRTGTVGFQKFLQEQRDPVKLQQTRLAGATGEKYVLAALVQAADWKPEDRAEATPGATDAENVEEPAADDEAAEDAAAEEADKPRAIYVADVDLLAGDFVALRARPDQEIGWQMENITFVLNILDELSGQTEYLDIRKKKVRHKNLTVVENLRKEYRSRELERRKELQQAIGEETTKAEAARDETVEKFQSTVQELQNRRAAGEQVSQSELREAMLQLQMNEQLAEQRFQRKAEEMAREFQDDIDQIRRGTALSIERRQNAFKAYAIGLPLIPPILTGLAVFLIRRYREREGISSARLK